MNRIAVFFPGIGYHCDKPLLYFSRELVQEAGFEEIVNVNYSGHFTNLRGNAEKMREAGLVLFAQAEEALKNIYWPNYSDVLFISKSVGTAIAAAYAERHGVVCRNVFYTPVALTFGEHPHNGIAFTGDADPWVEPGLVEKECQTAGIPLTVIKGANHSLETGDALRNLVILKSIMEQTEQFIHRKDTQI